MMADKNKSKSAKAMKRFIVKQMEFYFSDASLSKDRFLPKLIGAMDDRYIDIAVFTKFNKIRAVSTDIEFIAAALRASRFLEVSEDGRRVRRVTPFVPPTRADVDERTIYVECLPPVADHEWIQSYFAPWGKVVYVSLPKYRSTEEIKGFAFVEFSTAAEAQKACQEHGTASEEGKAVGHFPVLGNKELQRLRRQAVKRKRRISQDQKRNAATAFDERTRKESAGGEQNDETKRARLEESVSSGDDVTSREQGEKPAEEKVALSTETTEKRGKASKRQLRRERSMSESDATDKEADIPVMKKARKSSNDAELSGTKQSESTELAGGDQGGKRKKRQHSGTGSDSAVSTKRRRTTSSQSESALPSCKANGDSSDTVNPDANSDAVEQDQEPTIRLRVMPKKEWLEAKKAYLVEQKDAMKKLKAELREFNSTSCPPQRAQQTPVGQRTIGAQSKSGGKQSKSVEEVKTNSVGPQFTPGVIVKVTSTQPMTKKALAV